MKFCEKLNEYINTLSCTAKELAAAAEISPAAFSRYRSGERVPETGSKAFEGICRAVAEISSQKGADLTAASVRDAFAECEDFFTTDKEHLRRNFNTLISVLNINITRLCQYMNYDPSAIFRIRSGTRNPGDSEQFASSVASFTAREMSAASEISAVAELIGCEPERIYDLTVRYTTIKSWLLEQPAREPGGDSVSDFLCKLDSFDLNEYIKIIRFDELKVPSLPFQIPTSKSYFGIEEMMESELDFLKATVLSRSTEPVTMYSDMPMKEMAKDPEFPKKWMYGMALMLKKGLHLNQIHNIDRSFDEMMLGLESWIPMYMTGQISPYYFKNTQNNVFLHFLKVSGAAALSGEAIAGCHADGRYYLTKSKREIEYYRRRADEMLANAYPLMDIYRSERENELNTFLIADTQTPGNRRSILSTLPVYTMSKELLENMLTHSGIGRERREAVLKYAAARRRRVGDILKTSCITDEISAMTPADFAKSPPALDLSGAFCETDIPYSAEEYSAHLNETRAFAKENPNYTLKESSAHAFRNLQILIHEGQWAMVSKGKAPAIHFVIRHPKLRAAIEGFIPPVNEQI